MMKRILLYIACSIPIISMILLIMCGELPTDPKDDPNNVSATFFSTSSSEIYYQDQQVEIGIIIRYPALTKRIRVAFGDNLPNDTLFCDAAQGSSYDTVKTTRTYSDSGKKIINLDVDLINGSVKQFPYELKITPKQLTVSFDTVPPNHTIETGKPDTMTFTASTSPSGGAIEFTVESQPVLNSSNLKIVDLGSKAMVITTAPSDTTYDITVIAKSGTATKNAMVKLKSEEKSILQEKSSVTTMPSGASDTLVFTIGATGSDTINSIKILNAAAFKTGEIMRVVTRKDTLSFVFSPSETKVYTFSVEVTMDNKKDTLSYSISVTKETPLFTVTYLGHGNTAGNVPVDVNKYETGTPVTIAPADSLVKSGFTLAGWNTAADGSGTLRTAGSSFPMGNADVSLYAQWVVNTVQPSIVTQPISQTVCAGTQVSFSVIASGTAPLSYQWRKDNVALSSQPDSCTLSLSNVTPTNAGVYTVKVWNSIDSVISTACRLSVLPKTPSVPSATVRTAFSIGVSWSTTDGAAWYRLLRSSNSSAFASICSTSQTSTVDTPLVEGGSYLYRIIAGNNDGLSDTSSAISATTINGPSITTPLHDLSVTEGQPITLMVGATGNPTCTYLWKKDGSSDTIGTTATLTITQAALSDAGTYVVVVTNSVRSIESRAVITILPTYSLTLTQAPPAGCSITKVKDTAVYISGSMVTLTATAPAGSGYRFYKWSGDTSASGNVLSIIMRKNWTITPVFVKLCTLTLSTSDFAKGTVSSTAGNSPLTVDSGTTIPITATQNSGYKFKQWSIISGQATITNASIASTSVKILGNATVQAKFGCITFRKDFPADYSLTSVVQGDDGSYGVLIHKWKTTGDETIVKLNTKGDSLWEKNVCHLGVFDESDYPIKISKLTNGFLSGRAGLDNTALVVGVSLDVNSTPLFTWNPEDDSSIYINIGSALQTSDGGFFLAGINSDQSKGIVIKTDVSRQKLWTANIDSLTMITECQQTIDNGFIMIDRGYSVVKINSTGSMTNFSTRFADISALSVSQISEADGYIVGGERYNSGAALVKLAPNGSIASGWPKIYGNYGTSDYIVSVRITSDGNFVFATRGGYYTKTTPDGEIMWEKKLSSSSIIYMDICKDGGFIIVSDSWIIKTDENGDTD